MSKLFLGTALIGAALAAGVAAADDKAGTAGSLKLDGGYTLVSGEKDGKAIPEERIKGSIVKFAGSTITGTDKDKKEFFASTYTLDASKSPAVIKMKSTSPKEAEAVGLVKKEGDTVTIIYALPGSPAPTEFNTKEGQHLFVLKNLNKKAKE